MFIISIKLQKITNELDYITNIRSLFCDKIEKLNNFLFRLKTEIKNKNYSTIRGGRSKIEYKK